MTVWQSNGIVERSIEDRRVWVPFLPDTDESHFLHAGPLRNVKRYVESRVPDPGQRWRWVRHNPNAWDFQTADTGDRP